MRTVFLTAVVITFATLVALSAVATRPLNASSVSQFYGVYDVRYYATNGPDAKPITAQEYETYRRARACAPDGGTHRGSSTGVWPRERWVVVVCAL